MMPEFGFMSRRVVRRARQNLFWLVLLVLVWLLCSGEARARVLTDRLATFPNWTEKPPTQPAVGDLIYPNWMAGTWILNSTLVELIAPLAPAIQTPGFESNQSLLHKLVTCDVRFEPRMTSLTKTFLLQPRLARTEVVADRAFNSLNLARAYLGQEVVTAVRVDPDNPNRQLTVLKGDRQLESTVISRATDPPSDQSFATTEIFLQVFRGMAQPYVNEVETTTAYQLRSTEPPIIEANQVTAIYLSPQDPNYFKARNQPVALYRYQLRLTALDSSGQNQQTTSGQTHLSS